MNVWTLRAAGGFIKGRICPSRGDPEQYVALVNQELVGGPDAAYASASEAASAADTFIMTRLKMAAAEYEMPPEGVCQLCKGTRWVPKMSQMGAFLKEDPSIKSPCPVCRDTQLFK